MFSPTSPGWRSSATYPSDPTNNDDTSGTSVPKTQRVPAEADFDYQLELRSRVDVLRRMILDSTSFNRARHINYRNERKQLSGDDYGKSLDEHFDRDLQSVRFRPDTTDSQAAFTAISDLLRFQIKACRSPEDFARVVSVAAQREFCIHILASSSIQWMIRRHLERLDPHRVLIALNKMAVQFGSAGLKLTYPLIHLATRCAATTHNLTALKRWLWKLREHVSAESIKLKDEELLPILEAFADGCSKSVRHNQGAIEACILGFSDTSVKGKDYCLESFVSFNNLQTYAIWFELLRKIEFDSVHIEQKWKQLERSHALEGHVLLPRVLHQRSTIVGNFMLVLLQRRHREDAWRLFTEYGPMIASDHPVWIHVLEDRHSFSRIREVVPMTPELLRHLEHCLVDNIEPILRGLENELRIEWVKPTKQSIEPYHAAFSDWPVRAVQGTRRLDFITKGISFFEDDENESSEEDREKSNEEIDDEHIGEAEMTLVRKTNVSKNWGR